METQKNSIREYLTREDKENEILLDLNSSKSNLVFILVEGIDDIRLYGKFFYKDNVEICDIPGGVEELKIALINLSKFKNVIGIRDADFCHLDNKYDDIDGLFYTDYHDIEMMMISSDTTFQNVMLEKTAQHLNINSIRETIFNAITYIGRMRWFNNTYILKLDFDKFPFQVIIDEFSFDFNKEKSIEIINKRSKDKIREIQLEEIENYNIDINDYYNLCCGHDFIDVLNYYLFINFKTPKNIDEAFRLAYTFDEFSKTKLYNSLKEYQMLLNRRLFNYQK